jgi:hypothetical protein
VAGKRAIGDETDGITGGAAKGGTGGVAIPAAADGTVGT